MTLAFSQQLNGKPTFFTHKIITGLYHKSIISFDVFCELFYKIDILDYKILTNKIHTIRKDEKNKWKAGNLIHFVINNRTVNRYQFAPVIKCVSTQTIIIKYWYSSKTQLFNAPEVYIEGKRILGNRLLALAQNDGFNTVKDFFQYFNTDFEGKLIHWTDYKY